MSDTNGKSNGANGKGHELGITHKGNLVPAHLAEHCFKPGESGNPSGLPKNPKPPKDFVAHLRGFFDEKVKLPTELGKPDEFMGRDEYLAKMIGQQALDNPDHKIRLEYIKLVLDRLYPKTKDSAPFVVINNNIHTQKTIGFFTHVERMAGAGPVTPELMLEMLEKSARGELEDC